VIFNLLAEWLQGDLRLVMNLSTTKMSKFNNYVDYLMEVDTTTQEPAGQETPTTSQGTGRDFVMHILTQIPELGNLKKNLTDKIMNTTDKATLDLLNRRIDRPEDVVRLVNLLQDDLQVFSDPNTVKDNARQVAATGTATQDIEPKKQKTGLGYEREKFDQSRLEQAIYNAAYDWKQGTMLKKVQMMAGGLKKLGNVAKGVLSPTAAGSTGVFS
jgi:hypothetical protein